MRRSLFLIAAQLVLLAGIWHAAPPVHAKAGVHVHGIPVPASIGPCPRCET